MASALPHLAARVHRLLSGHGPLSVRRLSDPDGRPTGRLRLRADWWCVPGRSPLARGDLGMTTAEYAIGTLAACAFAGVLIKVLTSPRVGDLLTALITKALSVAG